MLGRALLQPLDDSRGLVDGKIESTRWIWILMLAAVEVLGLMIDTRGL